MKFCPIELMCKREALLEEGDQRPKNDDRVQDVPEIPKIGVRMQNYSKVDQLQS